jgi:hypothetical protein
MASVGENSATMQRIRARYGAAIAEACRLSSLPPAFLAALVANESGGNAGAKRFEKGVLDSLWEVLLGRSSAYGSIQRDDILRFVCPPPKPILPGTNVSVAVSSVGSVPPLPDSMQRLDSLATSHGLTQVMGYEAIAFHLDGVERLQDPAGELPITVKMLTQFAERFALDLRTDSSLLFDCWNTGRPHAQTFDPSYIPNGLARMAIYQQMETAAVPSSAETST